MADNQTSELAQAIQDVTEKASLLVREEIELAKTEMTEKATKLARGAVVGMVAGIFALAGLIYLLHALSWLLYRVISANGQDVWIGYGIVAVALFVLGGIAGFIAARSIKRGSPPTPAMAIEEGRLIRETVTTSRPATPLGPAGTVPAPTTTNGRS
jgi:uncharacterized membrane protein YqjE